jgi:uncharacterized membrane protein
VWIVGVTSWRHAQVNNMKNYVFTGVCAVLLSAGPCLADPGAAPPDWTDVSGIFAKRCTMCHSEQGAAKGLRLDSYEAAVAGSEKGRVLLPGDAEHSELIRRLRGQSTPRMPFLSRPLPDDQIDLIARWIAAGLPQAPVLAAPAE